MKAIFPVTRDKRLFERYDLNHKVDQFIRNYADYLENSPIPAVNNYRLPKALRDYIEAKAFFTGLQNPWNSCDGLYRNKKYEWRDFEHASFLPGSTNEEEVNEMVLYRVIERGGNRYGGRRGLVFAEEFGLDVNIPVAYAIDWSDDSLSKFLGENSHKLNMNTVCPIGYFQRNSDSMKSIEEMTLREVFDILNILKFSSRSN